MKKSKITKHSIVARNIFWFLSFLSNVGLILGFFIYGIIAGTNKYSIALVGLVGMILAILSLLLKKHWRTPLIIVLGGLYFVIQQFAVILIIIAIAIMLDELIFTPLYIHFKNKAMINKEIDRRGL